MDPNANLREQRELVQEIYKIWDACPENGEFTQEQKDDLSAAAIRLAELVNALDGWIRDGGFIPDSWEVAQGRR